MKGSLLDFAKVPPGGSVKIVCRSARGGLLTLFKSNEKLESRIRLF